MEDGRILDSQLTVSSKYNEQHGPVHARLNRPAYKGSAGSWVSRFIDAYQWIQVDLGFTKMVSGIVLQGRNGNFNQYVTRYRVMYSDDANSWRWVKDSNGQNNMVRRELGYFNCWCVSIDLRCVYVVLNYSLDVTLRYLYTTYTPMTTGRWIR